MSETVENDYPSLSEATENDVREAPVVEAEPVAEPVAPDTPPEPVEAATEVAETETVEDTDSEQQARNARLARDLREQRRRARDLELENLALKGQRTETRDETVEREIQQRANQQAQWNAVTAKSNEIYQEGIKTFGRVEFDESCRAMNEAFGQQVMPVVLDTLVDLPGAQRLIQHLGDNPDLADRLASLPPHKLGAALASEAAKLNTPKPKPVSKAPPPIRPIATQATSEPETDIEKMSMEQLSAMWDKRDFERRFR